MDLSNSGKAKHVTVGHIVNQFLQKIMQIILGSRISASYSWNEEVKKSDKWYNLVLRRHVAAMDDLCSGNRTLKERMVIDVILVNKSRNFSSDMSHEVVLERWIIWFESHKSELEREICGVSWKKTYRKLIILLRSVYTISRLLPDYEVFRKLGFLRKNCDFDITYNVSFVSGSFSGLEELTKKYNFVPVEGEHGRFWVSVFYREDLSNFGIDNFVLHPLEIINDHVDSSCPSSTKSPSTTQKVLTDAKQDCSRSPYFGSSRISKKSLFVFDDSDFSCPFIVDDTDYLDSQVSLNVDGTNSSEVSLKSQDAVLGAVVRLLRRAPPIRKDSRCYNKSEKKEGSAFENQLFKPRKISDALEELKLYKGMKDMLLAKNAALNCIDKPTDMI